MSCILNIRQVLWWLCVVSSFATCCKASTTSPAAASSAAPWTACLARERARMLPLVHPLLQQLKTSFSNSPSSTETPLWSRRSLRQQTVANESDGTTPPPKSPLESLWYSTRVAIAGGVGGAVGTAVLYPFDSAKTLRQSNPLKYDSVRHALWTLLQTPPSAALAASRQWHIGRAYAGLWTATLGAIPSSALYFGAYETCKSILRNQQTSNGGTSLAQRGQLHCLAAICGNCCSSAIFVPKELIKQQLQYTPGSSLTSVAHNIYKTRGIAGFYQGYQATLLRNIPSAMIRFALYEELKVWLVPQQTETTKKGGFDVRLFAAGAIAGAVASGLMTPMDVMKTRIATGTCPVDVKSCVGHVWHEQGLRGVYAGAGSRMLWSGAFSAIGFGTFEWTKSALGVSSKKREDDDNDDMDGPQPKNQSLCSKK